MKKYFKLTAITAIVAAASLAASSASFAYANYKGENYKNEVPPCKMLSDGFYAGLGISYDSYRVRQSTVFGAAGLTFAFNPAFAARGVDGDVFLGYGRDFDMFYIGLEGNYDYSGANSTFGLGDVATIYNSTFRARSSWGIGVLPGVKVNEGTLLYVRLGYIDTQFRTKQSLPLVPFTGGNTTNWTSGFRGGLGMETVLCDNFSLRGEYDYSTYSSFNGAAAFHTSYSPTNSSYELSAIYHFV
jgi:outer membrane immunogenic protein